MKKLINYILFIGISVNCLAQQDITARVTVLNDAGQPMPAASVHLLKSDSTLVKVQGTDQKGVAEFSGLQGAGYLFKISYTGYENYFLHTEVLQQGQAFNKTVTLKQLVGALTDVTVTSKKPFVQFRPDKTVINVDAGITNAGATVMDVLEKSPGVTVGRDGTIILKGKPQVMILIDGKQTQLSGTELQAYLSGLSASTIDVIELIENPGARYDAAGNAGIINIKTKTSKQKGFNGSLSLSAGQGFYGKSNNSLNLNYRTGKFNVFLNYGVRLGNDKMNVTVLRKYHAANGSDSLLLDQPAFTKTGTTSHNLKTGIDFFAGKRTTFGLVFTGNINERNLNSASRIAWMTPAYVVDSTIFTEGTRDIRFERAGINFNVKHTLADNSELLADIDLINFDITGDQYFQTKLDVPGSPVQATKGNTPSNLKIFTAKLDYSKQFKTFLLEAGIKTARTNTDNLASYYFNNGATWQDDLGRSNHFLYDENIHSVYSSVDAEKGKWHWQMGLRYELTSYKANQLGNTVVKDSAFKRNYGSLFPSAFVSYNADSNNNFTLRVGRRIDRPQFQNLNPFLVTLNKYTYEGGNPFILPQYTWKFELVHSYKQVLSTSLSYSYLKDYFSQIFIIDSNSSNVDKNIIIYTRGNVGTFHNLGASITLQLPVTKWWNMTSIAVYNHKIINGVVWAPIKATIDQLNFSLSNQFQFKKGWSAELSGYYQTKSQIDLQEWLTPQGELGAGVGKQILKNKGSLRLNIRDIFRTVNYSGYSTFENANEPFALKFDTRIVRLTFSW
ncbi:MAG TPA: outer membrane beta-barrel protein, partial [Chitinophagaceae bacterium]|nr:outer membrane beta-barrel protein [Chitinophagaceae bacterium]